MRVAGIMSGTSVDGVDVAIVDIAGKRIRTVGHAGFGFKPGLRGRILAVSNANCGTGDISELNFELGEVYAQAVLDACVKCKVAAESIELVGSHGQTIYHNGLYFKRSGQRPNTLQIGEASVIAERLGVPVVSDFRTRDIAAGGQGAPLVPLVDYLLFGSTEKSRVALNIGGIANVTILPRGGTEAEVVAFDTGPGNMVMDQLVEFATGGKSHYDAGGRMAARGYLNRPLLDKLLRDPYFTASPPKSAGREQYGKAFVERMVATGLPLPDLVATATAFTAAAIASGIGRFGPPAGELIVSGGGVHNRQLMAQIQAFLPAWVVQTSADFGVDPDAKEAIAFAVLAYRTWKKQTGNLPSATGARRAVVLGKVTFGTR